MMDRARIAALSPARSLAARIVFLVVGLLLVVQIVSFTSIRGSIDRNARETLVTDLAFAESVAMRLLRLQGERLAAETGVFADDYGFKSTLGSDRPTIESVLQYRAYNRLRANAAAVLDADRRVEAAWNIDDAAASRLVASIASISDAREGARTLVTMVNGAPMQFVLAPVVVQGRPAHALLAGFPLAERLVRGMQDFSAVGMTVLAPDASGEKHVIATSLETAISHDELVAAARRLGDHAADSLVKLAGEDHLVRAVPLTPDGSVQALLARSLEQAVAPYRALQWGLALLTLAGVLAFAIGSVFTARHVTTPLRSLVAAAERVGGGDYETPIRTIDSRDEVGDLAVAFEKMRANVAAHQAEIHRLAYRDRLTDLPNRAQFAEALQARLDAAKGGHGRFAIVMFDLDRFKHVNDVLGYAVGDLLLVQVADRLRAVFDRAGAMVARLSGDEFAVLLSQADAGAALVAAGLIEASFAEPLVIDEQTIDIAAGIGVACAPEHGIDAETLLACAEVAMYTAKRSTSGPVVYDPRLDAASAQTLSLLSDLRQAVSQGELRLYLQPRMSIASGALAGAEALVRWQHPERGLVPPGDFIPFAEQTGFIRTLTHWVFEEACRRRRELTAAGLDLSISLNLSARDLVDVRLPERFAEMLSRYGTPASGFCLEITESTIMDDPERALQTVERLHAMGFRLAIDDFGTGYSSLAYLKRLPVDELKIDKSFVFGMARDPEDAKIVRSTIDLAHNLGLAVVAEGVETAEVVALLRDLHCDEGQGYHYARPMPIETFMAWAHAHVTRQGVADPACL